MRLPIWLTSVATVAVMMGCSGSDWDEIMDPGAPGDLGGRSVSADQAQGLAATVTFQAASDDYFFAIQWRFFDGPACTGNVGSTFNFPAVTSTGVAFAPTTWSSMEVTAASISNVGSDFTIWSGSDGLSVVDPTICVPAPIAPQIYTATYGGVVNTAPTLDEIGDRDVDEGTTLGFAASATDAETPDESLAWSVAGAPTGAAISADGSFTWTPGESDGPGSFSFDVCVHDNGIPPLGDCENITVDVAEVNQAPAIEPISDQSVDLGSMLQFTAHASDPDLPANMLAFSLNGAPAGATIDPTTGAFSWLASAAGEFAFDVVVTDNGSPALSVASRVLATVHAPPPEIGAVMPIEGSAFRVGTTVYVTAAFIAPSSQDHGTCLAVAQLTGKPDVFGSEGTGVGTCTSALHLPGAGSYLVTYTVSDAHGMTDEASTSIVAYDPSAGSLAANGWFATGPESGAAACVVSGNKCSPTGALAGGGTKAMFNFNSRYIGSAAAPMGHVSFRLNDMDLRFFGLHQRWLVVDAEAGTAALSGVGSVVGSPDLFGFRAELQQADGAGPDRIHVRIWRGTDEGDVIYDSGPDRPLGGGTIRINRKGPK